MLNDRPIQVLAARPPDSQDWLATPSDAHQHYAIDFAGKTRGLGSTVGPFCYVARGSAVIRATQPVAADRRSAGFRVNRKHRAGRAP